MAKPDKSPVLPKLEYDEEWKGHRLGKRVDPNNSHSSGAPFETHRPMEQNIEVWEGEGNDKKLVKTFTIDQAALATLAKRNVRPGGRADAKTLDYESAAKMAPTPAETQMEPEEEDTVEDMSAGEAEFPPEPPQHPVNLQDRVDAPMTTHVAGHPPMSRPQVFQAAKNARKAAMRPAPQAAAVAGPANRILVRFTSPMGRAGMPFYSVFRDEDDAMLLVMVQYIGDGTYFQPPMGEEQVTVEVGGQTFVCQPAIHYKMPDGKFSHTVYLVVTPEE